MAFGPQGSTQTSVTGDTHADLPSTSSLPGWTPFLARIEDTFSTSPLSAAFINRSSYLFHSAESYKKRREEAGHTTLVSFLTEGRKQKALRVYHSVPSCTPNPLHSAMLTWPGQRIIYLRTYLVTNLLEMGFLYVALSDLEPGWPSSHRDPSASAFLVLGLKAYKTSSNHDS